jgi:hypothetical protein
MSSKNSWNEHINNISRALIAAACILIGILDFLGVLGNPNGFITPEKIPSMILVVLGLVISTQLFEPKPPPPATEEQLNEVFEKLRSIAVSVEILDTDDDVDGLAEYLVRTAKDKIDIAIFGGVFLWTNDRIVPRTTRTAQAITERLKEGHIVYRCILGYDDQPGNDNSNYKRVFDYIKNRINDFKNEGITLQVGYRLFPGRTYINVLIVDNSRLLISFPSFQKYGFQGALYIKENAYQARTLSRVADWFDNLWLSAEEPPLP